MTELEGIDMSEGATPSEWEQRFEGQINSFFDEAIERVPRFVDQNLRSFRKVMGRSLHPKTALGDLFVGVRNVVSGVSTTVGGPEFSTTTWTQDQLTAAFEEQVVSGRELEVLIERLFKEFESELWKSVADKATEPIEIDALKKRWVHRMESEIAHDPLLAQAIRAGVKIGVPATLGYALFGRVTLGGLSTDAYKKNLTFYHKLLNRIGGLEVPGWMNAVGWAGGIIGTMAVTGLMEFTINSIRDIKGQYIRQINAARYDLLYGDDPADPDSRGLMHVVRGLERQFEKVGETVARDGVDALEHDPVEPKLSPPPSRPRKKTAKKTTEADPTS